MFKKSGFTLIELMVVLSIIFTTTVVLAWPGVADMVEYYRLHSVGHEVYCFFQSARQEAIFNQKNILIDFATEKDIIMMKNEKGKVIDQYILPQYIKLDIEQINFGLEEQVVFKPAGTARNGHLILKNAQKHSFRIIVYGLTGRVRFEKGG